MAREVDCYFLWNPHHRMWEMYRLNDDFINDFHHCKGSQLIFGVRNEDKNKKIYGVMPFFQRGQTETIEPYLKEDSMSLGNVIAKSQGWTTHFHCSTGLILCLIGLLCLLFGMEKISGIFAFLTLASILAAQGCMREKLETMSK